MKNESDYSFKLPSSFEYPKIKWRLELWIGLFSFLFALLLFVLLDSVSSLTIVNRIIISVIILFLLVLIPLFFWSIRIIILMFKRQKHYSYIYDAYLKLDKEYKDAISNLSKLLIYDLENHSYEISEANYFEGDIYISIDKKPNKKLSKDDIIALIDTEDGYIFGLFKVIQILEKAYYAIESGSLDRVFASYIYGKGKVSFLPNKIGYHIRQGEINE